MTLRHIVATTAAAVVALALSAPASALDDRPSTPILDRAPVSAPGLGRPVTTGSRTSREATPFRRAGARLGPNSPSIPIGGQSCNWLGGFNYCWMGGSWYDAFWWMDVYAVTNAYGWVGFVTCYTGNRGFGPRYCYAGLPG